MFRRAIVVIWAAFFTTEVQALTEERTRELYDILDIALKCDAASSFLKKSKAVERERLLAVIAGAGKELGEAMLKDEMLSKDPGFGRRCLVHYSLQPAPQLSVSEMDFRISYELGKASACFQELFVYELLDKVPSGPLAGGNSEQEIEDRKRIQEFALQRFDDLGCASLRFPD